MKRTGNPIYYADSNAAEELVCSLCGKHGGISFKKAAVCEKCLEYIKTHY